MSNIPGLATYQKKEIGSGPPFAVGSANNGLSVDIATGKIVLGENAGDVLQPAKVLTDREIPMDLAGGVTGIFIVDAAGIATFLQLAPSRVLLSNAIGDFVQLFQSAAAGGGGAIVVSNAAGDTGMNINYGVMQIFSPATAPFNSQINLITNGIAGIAATLDIDHSHVVAMLRFFRSNPALGIFFDLTNQRIGIGSVVVPTARLHLPAGLAAVSGAPFKYTAGVLAQTVVENGTKNFDGTNESLAVAGVTYIIAKTLTATAVLAFPLTATLSSSDLTVAVAGAAVGDAVSLGADNAAVLPNSCYTAWVSAAGVVSVRFNNYSVAGQTPAAGTFRVSVTKY
jgi:hypothetical protein